MSAEKIIKSQARNKLRTGGWMKAVSAVLLLFLMVLIIDCIVSLETLIIESLKDSGVVWQLYGNSTLYYTLTELCNVPPLVIAFLLSPVLIGFVKMFYGAFCNGHDFDFSDLFFFFVEKRYKKSLFFVLGYVARMILPSIVFFLPVAIFSAIAQLLAAQSSVIDTGIAVLSILSYILLLLYSIRYFAAALLFCEDNTQPVRYYFTASKQIINNHTKEIVKLILSFIPWILLSVTVIPILYTLPYISQSLCISGKWLIELSRNGQD